MKSLQLQIQPDLQPNVDAPRMVNRVRTLVKKAPFRVEIRIVEDEGEQPCINVQLSTSELPKFWTVLKKELQKNKDLGASCIVVCEGKSGWDDYLLLHHFDSKETLDRLEK